MKISSIFKTGLLKAAVASALALPLAVSCFDPSGLQEQIDMLVDKVFELERFNVGHFDKRTVKVVNWHIEESLYLVSVEIHRDEAVNASHAE